MRVLRCAICGETGIDAGGLHKVVVNNTPKIIYQCNNLSKCDTVAFEKTMILNQRKEVKA